MSTKRNTPTCVGKTNRPRGGFFCDWKHPHVRGEDAPASRPSLPALETPPRAWGRHRQDLAHKDSEGNTPTCVGKTRPHWQWLRRWRKHPHVRG